MTTPSPGRGGQRRFTDGSEGFESAIGPGVTADGALRGSTDLRVMGVLAGDVAVDGLVWIGSEGRVEGTIEAADVLVEGTVTGSIRATGKIELRSSARVEATLEARLIAAAEGSFLEGSVTMHGEDGGGVVTFTEKRADDGTAETD